MSRKEIAERVRLSGDPHADARWRKWGPYLADRAWGTVREDYSENGDAWRYLPHDLARSKAFRWGEDGIAGFCDRYETLCWSLALWNERDPILKERLFGLDAWEGNHGEDVKECYFYTDALPTHAYQRMLYKYPQRPFPYGDLVAGNRRSSAEPELELIDTGIFDDNRYFDVDIEIAKDDPETILFRITVANRGPERAVIHLIPQLWYRNTWSWGGPTESAVTAPVIRPFGRPAGRIALLADDSQSAPLAGLLADSRLGPRLLDICGDGELLFTDNETNGPRVFGPGATSRSRFTKDAFHRRIVGGDEAATNPGNEGTKACARLRYEIPPGESVALRMRLGPWQHSAAGKASDEKDAALERHIDTIVIQRRAEADEFYDSIHPPNASNDERNVQRQAFAGMLWNKQCYLFDVDIWLDGDDPSNPPPAARQQGRNRHWRHLNSMRVLSMPDKWEYPWFAAWDLAFHSVTLALIDAGFAKEQLWLMLFEQFQHPNGQIPAYEWEFSDLNPPVYAWAVWRVYNMDRIRSGRADREFLEKCFHKLLLNFTWWVNKVDREGNNVFEGGFLGLDNIAVFDRSDTLPDGASLEQSDATGWMGMFSQVMMRIALELATDNPAYEGLATKFFEHYVYIGAAMKMVRGGRTLWDQEDGFFYDLLRLPNGDSLPFRVRSLVGLIPLYAIERLESAWIEPFRVFSENLHWFMKHRKDIVERCITTVKGEGTNVTYVLAVVDREQLQRILGRIIDPAEFLSPHGIRSLSRIHATEPFRFGDAEVRYEPGNAVERVKGGNSNWRGPVWMPTNFLLIETLRKLEKAFGGQIRVMIEPTEGVFHTHDDELTDMRMEEGFGAGATHTIDSARPGGPDSKVTVTLSGLAGQLADRLIGIFTPNGNGYRPLNGPAGTRKSELFAHDPHWKDLILFHEYFHGDTAEGLGASHQTGWTGLVASLIDEWRA